MMWDDSAGLGSMDREGGESRVTQGKGKCTAEREWE